MDLKQAVYKRRSIRKFKDKPVDKELIKKIIEYGTQAPTACNIQGWRFIIVDRYDLKKWLVDSGGPLFIQNSPIGILVLYDNRTGNLEYKDYIQSAGATIQNMVLAAYSFGLGSCWVCRLPSQATMKKIFKIPKEFDVIAYIAFGYPDFIPKPVLRKYKPEEIISTNAFKGKINTTSIKRRIYLMTPKPIKLFYRLCFEGRFFKKFKEKYKHPK